MKYRKFRADHIFDGERFLAAENVLITDESGEVEGFARAADHPDAAYYPGTISPGFINTHCHLELSWMKGHIPAGTGMIDFLLRVITTKPPSEDLVVTAAREAEQQMIASGIVAVGDICNTAATLPVKRLENLYYHNFIEVMGIDATAARQRFAQAANTFRAFTEGHQMPMAQNSVVPHAPYSVSELLLEQVVHFPGNHLLSMHNQEHAAENELFLHGSGDFHRLYKAIGFDSSGLSAKGSTSLAAILPGILRNQSIILVHNVDTGEPDLELIKQTISRGVDCILCLCPNANLYINGQLPDVYKLVHSGLPITVGTDSLASNHSLDMLAEIKTIHRHFTELPVAQLLQWTTINGARALEIEETSGSFAKGKQPGIVWLKGVTAAGIEAAASAHRLL